MKEEDGPEGVPNFWLTIFKTDAILTKMLHEADEPALAYLSDIRIQSGSSSNFSFVIEFHFLPNEYFSNETLTKEY